MSHLNVAEDENKLSLWCLDRKKGQTLWTRRRPPKCVNLSALIFTEDFS
jgi:hypothetical protein